MLTVDPTRLGLNGRESMSPSSNAEKLMASKEFDNSEELDKVLEPSVTNTHCLLCRSVAVASPTCTTNPAMSNSLKNEEQNTMK